MMDPTEAPVPRTTDTPQQDSLPTQREAIPLALALFPSYEEARRAVHALRDRGIPADRIAILVAGEHSLESLEPADVSTDDALSVPYEGISTTTPADAAHGATIGAAVGAGLGVASVLASLIVPGFGLVTASGVLAQGLGAIAAATAGGAVVGGLAGYLRDLGVPEPAAQEYAGVLEQGGVLVGVPAAAVDAEEIRSLFSKYQGRPVGTVPLAPPHHPAGA